MNYLKKPSRYWPAIQFLVTAAVALIALTAVNSNVALAGDPQRCEGLGNVDSISLTNWESGLAPWVAGTHDVVNDDGTFLIADWAVVGNLPDSRSGSAAFVANPVGEDDDCFTSDRGALNLDSPVIQIPAGTIAPRISVNHWYDIEFGWDGGNFKISVNGGPFNLIPGSAIELGSYNGTLFDANTMNSLNPLAGQDAYTGPESAWMQSRINLQGIASAGDTIKLRIDFGVDECGGNTGWYVDEVEFYRCSGELPPADTSLTLNKTVINNNGGNAAASAWMLAANGPTSFSGSGPSVSSGGNFTPGTYTLSESGGPPGYSASTWNCVGGTQLTTTSIQLAEGQKATCTITNDDISPTLKVVKTILNNNGGPVTDPNAFELKVDGEIVLNNVANQYDAGNYFVSETNLPDYVPGPWGGDCNANGTITLALAQNAVCTVTNEYVDTEGDVIFQDSFE